MKIVGKTDDGGMIVQFDKAETETINEFMSAEGIQTLTGARDGMKNMATALDKLITLLAAT